MRCPVCGSLVDDGLEVCPACRAELSATHVLPKLTGTWCASCGALIPTGSTSCPKCHMPCATPPAPVERPKPSTDELPEGEVLRREREETASLPRIESAIPSEPDPATDVAYGRERLPRTRVFALAAIASLIVVGGATLAITHPWDPTLTDTRATTPADTSQAGFPGTVERLSGQDSDTSVAISVESADEATYTRLLDAYEQLAELSERADASLATFDEIAISGSDAERESAAAEADQLALDVSNLVADIKEIDTATTGTYTDQKDHVATLASWLRNYIEAIDEAWTASVASSNPKADMDQITSPLAGQRESDAESYSALFAKNYEAWKPEQR